MTFKPALMYHHIKDDYKRGITPDEFRKQFLAMKDLFAFTFDDGLKEHYTVAFPLLKKWGVIGYFFPIGETLKGVVNHVHKGHVLLDRFEEDLIRLWNEHSPLPFTFEHQREVSKYRFDSEEIAGFKSFMAFIASTDLKNTVFDEIMRENSISIDVEKYYMTRSELREIADQGMIIGNHTMTHPNLAGMALNPQKKEILESHALLKRILDTEPNVFSYPYGTYNEHTIDILNSMRYYLGFTTNSTLEVGRLDCKEATLR